MSLLRRRLRSASRRGRHGRPSSPRRRCAPRRPRTPTRGSRRSTEPRRSTGCAPRTRARCPCSKATALRRDARRGARDPDFAGPDPGGLDPRRPRLQLLAGRRARARPLAPRRASRATASGAPQWETLVDFDGSRRTSTRTGSPADQVCLSPEYRHCMVECRAAAATPRPGASSTRRTGRSCVPGSPCPRPSRTSRGSMRTRCSSAPTGAREPLTESGYPRIVKVWRRGTPLAEAKPLFEGLAR